MGETIGESSESPYRYLTSEIIQKFDASIDAALHNIESQDGDMNEFFIELITLYQEETLDVKQVIDCLSKTLKNDTLASEFIGIYTSFPTDDQMKTLIKEIERSKLIKRNIILNNLEKELLQELNLVRLDFNRKIKTELRDNIFTQKRFNLLHEESEGFSKLIVELYSSLCAEDSIYQVEYIHKVVEQLTGHYNLDPNRVLDIILDIFINNFVKDYKFAIKFLQSSQWWPQVPADNSSMETLSVGGNEIATKLIGIKIKNHREGKDLPETFKLLVGVLIKENFISFGSIYKYLGPNDEEMDKLNEAYKVSMEEKAFKAGASALALAAPLLDDEEGTKSSGSSNTVKPTNSKKPDILNGRSSNLKLQFLKIFLGIGLYWPSIFILNKYPFLAELDDDVSDLINRMMAQMIIPLYDSIKPVSDDNLRLLQTSKKMAFSRTGNTVSYEDFPCVNLLSFKALITSYSGKHFHFFYDNWNQNLPIANDRESLFKISKQFLKYNGTKLNRDISLFTKLCEIGIKSLTEDKSNENLDSWFNYFRYFIFPAMCLVEGNSFAIDSGYKMLQFFSLEERYNLYGELHNVLSKNNLSIKIAYGKAEKQTKDVLKRLTKENVRSMMRKLAKISFSNPLPCFLTILQQIESYDNLNTLVVETARYFNDYGWDVLTLALLMRLTNGRNLIQRDGLNDRQWIQSLSSFIGKICSRYPFSVDLNTLLDFILKTLHNKDSIGLIVLKEIFISMGGIQPITNLTLTQIEIMNCEPDLRKLAYRTIEDTRYSKLKSGTRLASVLIELKGVNELLILLCQLGDEIIYNDNSESYLKVLANKNDDLNQVIHLFTEVINFFVRDDSFTNQMLTINELVEKYGVSPEWAFEFWRKNLSEIISYNSHGLSAQEKSDAIDVTRAIPDYEWTYLTKDLYFSFWQLSLYDIIYTPELYENQSIRLKSTISGLKDKISLGIREKLGKAKIENLRSQLEQCELIQSSIPDGKKVHEANSIITTNRLQREHNQWFSRIDDANVDIFELQSQQFLQYCILPRAIHSSFDAIFTARFIFLLHDLKTENFSVILLLSEMINSKILFGTLFTLSPVEAENLGLFYAEVLKILSKWRDATVYESVVKERTLFEDHEKTSVSHDRFKELLFGFHSNILDEIIRSLSIEEYMSRRNSITFLKNLLGVYPNVEDHCELILEAIENVSNNDPRDDLKLSSNALIGHVKSRSKDWVHVWDFYSMSEDSKSEAMQNREARAALKKEKEKTKLIKKNNDNPEEVTKNEGGEIQPPETLKEIAVSEKASEVNEVSDVSKDQQEKQQDNMDVDPKSSSYNLGISQTPLSKASSPSPVSTAGSNPMSTKSILVMKLEQEKKVQMERQLEAQSKQISYDEPLKSNNSLTANTDRLTNDSRSNSANRDRGRDSLTNKSYESKYSTYDNRAPVADSYVSRDRFERYNSNRDSYDNRNSRYNSPKIRETETRPRLAQSRISDNVQATLNSNKEKDSKDSKVISKEKNGAATESTKDSTKESNNQQNKTNKDSKDARDSRDRPRDSYNSYKDTSDYNGAKDRQNRRSSSPVPTHRSTSNGRNTNSTVYRAPVPPPPPTRDSNEVRPNSNDSVQNRPTGPKPAHSQKLNKSSVSSRNTTPPPPPPPPQSKIKKRPLPPQSSVVPDPTPPNFNARENFSGREHYFTKSFDRPSGPRDRRKNDVGRGYDKRQKH